MKVKNILLLAAIIGCAGKSPNSYASPVNNYTDIMDNSGSFATPWTGSNNVVGTISLSYTGSPLADGTYSYSSLPNLTVSIAADSQTWSWSDVLPGDNLSSLNVILYDGYFAFSGPGQSAYETDGSIDFYNSDEFLISLSPENYIPPSSSDYAFAYYIKDYSNDGVEVAAGQYAPQIAVAPTPEPGSLALAGLGGLSMLAFRRKKA